LGCRREWSAGAFGRAGYDFFLLDDDLLLLDEDFLLVTSTEPRWRNPVGV